MKKIISLLIICSLVLSAVSCTKNNGADISVSVNENYVEPTQSEETTTYRLQETPVKVADGVDPDIAALLRSYFDGYNKTESFTVLKAYTPTAYMNILNEKDEFKAYHMHIDSEVFQTNMYWRSMYGEDAIMILNEISSTTKLTDEQLEHTYYYFRQTYNEYPFEFNITDGVEVNFNYSISGSSGGNSSDMTVCAVRFESGEEEYGGWKLIMCGAEDLLEYTEE